MELTQYLEEALELAEVHISEFGPGASVAIVEQDEYIGLMAVLNTSELSSQVFHPVCPTDRYSGTAGVITMMSGDPGFAASKVYHLMMEEICEIANENYKPAATIDTNAMLELLAKTQKWRK